MGIEVTNISTSGIYGRVKMLTPYAGVTSVFNLNMDIPSDGNYYTPLTRKTTTLTSAQVLATDWAYDSLARGTTNNENVLPGWVYDARTQFAGSPVVSYEMLVINPGTNVIRRHPLPTGKTNWFDIVYDNPSTPTIVRNTRLGDGVTVASSIAPDNTSDNIVIGYQAGSSSVATQNTIIGAFAGRGLWGGMRSNNNTIVGCNSLGTGIAGSIVLRTPSSSGRGQISQQRSAIASLSVMGC